VSKGPLWGEIFVFAQTLGFLSRLVGIEMTKVLFGQPRNGYSNLMSMRQHCKDALYKLISSVFLKTFMPLAVCFRTCVKSIIVMDVIPAKAGIY